MTLVYTIRYKPQSRYLWEEHLQQMYNMETQDTAGVNMEGLTKALLKEGEYFPASHTSVDHGVFMDEFVCHLRFKLFR